MTRHALTIILCAFLALVPTVLRAEEALTKIEPLTIATDGDATMFTVEIADTDMSRERGLMFRQRLPEDRGMLFDFGEPRPVSMWMKNTYIPLDMLFIGRGGRIVSIAENTTPLSTAIVDSGAPVLGVLELRGGESRRRGIRIGDIVRHPHFDAAD
jgi:uncharacterized membrane protein (UPF0127 family)